MPMQSATSSRPDKATTPQRNPDPATPPATLLQSTHATIPCPGHRAGLRAAQLRAGGRARAHVLQGRRLSYNAMRGDRLPADRDARHRRRDRRARVDADATASPLPRPDHVTGTSERRLVPA